MRIITSETIVRTVKNLCLRANKFLPSDIKLTLDTAYDYEISPNGKRAIGNIIDNYKVSQQTSLPICQDTGMVVVFAEIGQDVHIVGELFEDAINEGVRQAYQQGNLRMSVVNDPLNRVNSQDNTPAIVHIRLVPGNSITLTVIPQGAGSENASSLKMFHPSATREDIIRYVVSCAWASAATPRCVPCLPKRRSAATCSPITRNCSTPIWKAKSSTGSTALASVPRIWAAASPRWRSTSSPTPPTLPAGSGQPGLPRHPPRHRGHLTDLKMDNKKEPSQEGSFFVALLCVVQFFQGLHRPVDAQFLLWLGFACRDGDGLAVPV